MSARVCQVCGTLLTRRQRRFCSRAHVLQFIGTDPRLIERRARTLSRAMAEGRLLKPMHHPAVRAGRRAYLDTPEARTEIGERGRRRHAELGTTSYPEEVRAVARHLKAGGHVADLPSEVQEVWRAWNAARQRERRRRLRAPARPPERGER